MTDGIAVAEEQRSPNQDSALGPGASPPKHHRESANFKDASETTKQDIRLDKSNILMLGPTGSGTYNVSHLT